MNVVLTLNEFSGPLDVLLALLDQKKMHITEIALSAVTEQYIEYLDTLSGEREQEIADFLVVATKLLLLKSRSLLPQLFPEEEREGPSLEEQLRLYRRFAEASRELNRRWEGEQCAIFRKEPPRRLETVALPAGLTLERVHESMVQLLDRIRPPKPLPKTHIDRSVSIKEKIREIQAVLKNTKSARFFGLIRDKKNRTEVIAGFLALLELAKRKEVDIKQGAAFSDIVIHHI